MKTIRELTCIGCPMGCALHVELEDGRVISVSGYTCNTGKIYAERECTHPVRIVTSSVPVDGGERGVVPVKTREAVPKDRIFDCIRALRGIRAKAPVREGDVILADAAGTGVDIIATADIEGK